MSASQVPSSERLPMVNLARAPPGVHPRGPPQGAGGDPKVIFKSGKIFCDARTDEGRMDGQTDVKVKIVM